MSLLAKTIRSSFKNLPRRDSEAPKTKWWVTRRPEVSEGPFLLYALAPVPFLYLFSAIRVHRTGVFEEYYEKNEKYRKGLAHRRRNFLEPKKEEQNLEETRNVQ